MESRKAESGPVVIQRDVDVTVPALLDTASADVALTADAAFAGGGPVSVAPNAAMLAGLATMSAWVSDTTTGVVTVRCVATVAGCAGGAQAVRITKG